MEGGGGGGVTVARLRIQAAGLDHKLLISLTYKSRNQHVRQPIRASVDDTSEISHDPHTKRLQTRRESLAMPSEHTNNNF